MCGIAGYCGTDLGDRLDQLTALWLAIQNRGGDASGVSWWAPGGPIMYAKRQGDPVDLIARYRDEWRSAQWIMFHCRLATHGEAKISTNNHPIVAHGQVVTHNGVILTDAVPRARRVTQCDTESINYILASNGAKGLADLDGSASVAWSGLNAPHKVRLYTNDGSPLAIADTAHGTMWASTDTHLKVVGVKDGYDAKPGVVYSLRPGKVTRTDWVGYTDPYQWALQWGGSYKALDKTDEANRCIDCGHWHVFRDESCWCPCPVYVPQYLVDDDLVPA